MPAESLDIEQPDALAAYLRARGRVGADEPVRIRTLAGGVSNKTVLVERPSGEAWVLKQALPKLRVAVDWFSDPARIHREALGLKYLAELAPPGTITPLVFEDAEHYLLAMEAVPQPHENWKTMLLAGHIDIDHVTQFGTLLGTIHRRSWEIDDWETGGKQAGELSSIFGDLTFFKSLRVEPYYRYTASVVPESGDFYRELIAAAEVLGLVLVHGDYSPKNILVRNGRLVLLDHEVIHWGDPAFDAGFALAHLLSKAHHRLADRERFKLAALQFGATYWDEIGEVIWLIDLERRCVNHTLGCLLARVAGRSPLEYLSDRERHRQRQVVLQLMHNPPRSLPKLVEQFVHQVGRI